MQYALPAIVAMTASSLYNIIDRAFIGQMVGPEAIAGLGITFPFMNLSGAFGAAVGVGASTCISVKLGQRHYKTAEHLLGNTVTLNLIVGFLFMAVCLIFLDPILRFFGASDVTLPYAREFMTVILLGNMVTHMYFGMNAVLRAAGKPRYAMYATLFTRPATLCWSSCLCGGSAGESEEPRWLPLPARHWPCAGRCGCSRTRRNCCT